MSLNLPLSAALAIIAKARANCLPVRANVRARVTSIQVAGWRSNNRTVVRPPFFRDNQQSSFSPWSCTLSHSMQPRGLAPCRLKGQSPSYLRFDQLPLSPVSSFPVSPSPVPLSFRFFSNAVANDPPRTDWTHERNENSFSLSLSRTTKI